MDANDYYLSQHMNSQNRYDSFLGNYSKILGDGSYLVGVQDVRREDVGKVMGFFMDDSDFIPQAYPEIAFHDDGTVAMYWDRTMEVNLSDSVDWEYGEDPEYRRDSDTLLHRAYEMMDELLSSYLGYRVYFEVTELSEED